MAIRKIIPNSELDKLALEQDNIDVDKIAYDFLRGLDQNKGKLRIQVLIEKLYEKATAKNSKEDLKAILSLIERIGGKPASKSNNVVEEKDDTVANEIHALTEAILKNNKKEDA